MDGSRIEDIMTMVVATATPPIVGGLTLRTTFVLPPAGTTSPSACDWTDGSRSAARGSPDDVQRGIEGLSRRRC